jgi:hypothetical protein
MRLDFEMGVAVGQALEQIKEHTGRIDNHETRIEKIETKVATAESWIGRVIAGASLWAASIGITLNADTLSAWLVRFWRAIASASSG